MLLKFQHCIINIIYITIILVKRSDIIKYSSSFISLVITSFPSIKGAAKSYFTHYLCVVIILLNIGLYKFAVSTYSFGKLDFRLSVFSMVLCLFCILNFDVILIRFHNTYVNQRHTLKSETIFGNRQPFKNDEKCFYFTSKALFVLKIFKFLS